MKLNSSRIWSPPDSTFVGLPFVTNLRYFFPFGYTKGETEFETRLQTAKTMGLKPRTEVPIDSETGVSTFSMNGKTYQHFYVLDPSWVNIEVVWRISELGSATS